jgi:hypothetical protein
LSTIDHSIINTAKKRNEEYQSIKPPPDRKVKMSDKINKTLSKYAIVERVCFLISSGWKLNAACFQIKQKTGKRDKTTKTHFFDWARLQLPLWRLFHDHMVTESSQTDRKQYWWQ